MKQRIMKSLSRFSSVCVLCAVCCWPAVAGAGALPSLFRGVVVADLESAQGVRVISVEEASQAFLADLRPEDLIVQVNDTRVRSIDEFAVVSHELRGRAITAWLTILRNGEPRQMALHLYSYPILARWRLTFVPDYDLRFAQPSAGAAYWERMGRGFEIAEHPEEALQAYLNALHQEPENPRMAVNVFRLVCDVAVKRSREGRARASLAALQESTVLLQQLFLQPLDEADLVQIKAKLQATQALIRGYQASLAN